MKKALVILVLTLTLALSACSDGVKIVPIESLSPRQTAANVFSQEPAATPSPTDEAPVVVARIDESGMTVSSRINPPMGYARVHAAETSFAAFLRAYPLKAAGAQVMLYNEEARQDAKAAAVLDLQLGKKNHEGPAGAMARLIAEYLYSQQRYSDISFTIGRNFDFTFDKWRQGKKLNKDATGWTGGGTDSNAEENFKAYLSNLFVYISMSTLDSDLVRVEDVDTDEIQVGDIFIGTNAAGKKTAVMVADLCQSGETGEKLMLLVQGGAPAQQPHIVENPADAALSPWYPCNFTTEMVTPDTTVAIEDRYRFKKFVDEE
jgi:hypothetical protein